MQKESLFGDDAFFEENIYQYLDGLFWGIYQQAEAIYRAFDY
jgi:hypothetical protein